MTINPADRESTVEMMAVRSRATATYMLLGREVTTVEVYDGEVPLSMRLLAQLRDQPDPFPQEPNEDRYMQHITIEEMDRLLAANGYRLESVRWP